MTNPWKGAWSLHKEVRAEALYTAPLLERRRETDGGIESDAASRKRRVEGVINHHPRKGNPLIDS